MKYKIGDVLNYCFYDKIEIIGIDEHHYILKDKKNNTKKIHIELVDKYATLEIPGK